jgi:hypothetical protein
MTGEIIVESGISWLRDELIRRADARIDYLKDGIAEGVPLHEYQAMVGRYKEAKRQRNIDIPEIFADFDAADAADDSDELEELSDD